MIIKSLLQLLTTTPTPQVKIVKLLLHTSSVGKFLTVVVVHLLPYVPKPTLQTLPKTVYCQVNPLIINTQVPQFEQILHPLNFLPYRRLLLLHIFP